MSNTYALSSPGACVNPNRELVFAFCVNYCGCKFCWCANKKPSVEFYSLYRTLNPNKVLLLICLAVSCSVPIEVCV